MKRIVENITKKLTPEQSSFFRNSKIRDDNGNLLILYHGSPKTDISEFRCDPDIPSSFFTRSYAYAYEYSADRDEYDKWGKVYSVYLNITNPFNAEEEKCQDTLNQIYAEYGEPKNVVIGSDLIYKYLKSHNTKYDGIIAREGLSDKMKSKYGEDADISYIPLYSNQVKSIYNTNPTAVNSLDK